MMDTSYEMVIGLEVHAELKTETKIFCDCPTTFGAAPNTQCCPVCTGLPGSLPVLNQQVVAYAVKAGLALNCEIAGFSKQDRKNYFYPDLPKAYQISQYDLPLCSRGHLDIQTKSGAKRIGITRIHIEEDAGKLIHDPVQGTLLDCNRCGVPLIEIVSEPDIRSAAEAVAYLQKLRSVLLYTGVSDCKMQEGSLRCDVNLSVRPQGQSALGKRAELKNLNSFSFIQKAINYEFCRQVSLLQAGEPVVQETRRFDEKDGKTHSMRRKENANDYRYFPDPDLVPIRVDETWLRQLAAEIPTLPDARRARYQRDFGLTPYDAEQLTADRQVADYFEQAAQLTAYPKLLCNLVLSQILRLLGDGEDSTIPIAPAHLATLCDLLGQKKIGSSTARQLLPRLWKKDGDPVAIIAGEDLWQLTDPAQLVPYVEQVLSADVRSVGDYKRGKSSALQALVGRTMKATGGRGDPAVIAALLRERLAQ